MHRELLSLTVTAAVAFGLRLAGVGDIGLKYSQVLFIYLFYTSQTQTMDMCDALGT